MSLAPDDTTRNSGSAISGVATEGAGMRSAPGMPFDAKAAVSGNIRQNIFSSALDRIAAWVARSSCLGDGWHTLFLRSSDDLEIFSRRARDVVSRGKISLSSLRLADSGKLRSQALRGASRRGNRARLRLGSDLVITKTMCLPLAAEDVIGGIIGNQLELIAPWRREDIRFGYRVRQRDAANGQLHVDIAATSAEILEAALGEMARHGLKPRIVDFGTGAADQSPILLEVRDQNYRTNVRSGLRLTSLAVLAAAFGSMLAGGWLLYGAHQRGVDLDRDIASTRAQLAKTSELARRADGPAATVAALWQYRAGRLPVTIAIEALSRAVPDDAWLEQIDINGNALTIVGVARDVTKLVPAIEASPQFSGAAFASPSTRTKDSGAATFVVTSQIQPRGELAP